MTDTTFDNPPRTRLAGVLYLAIIVLGIWSEMFVRSALIAPGDAAATATNILGSNGLFHLSFAADAIMALCDVAVGVLLYQLLKPVDRTLSLAAMAFRLMQTAIISVNLLNHFAAILLLFCPEYAAGFGGDFVNTQVLLFLDIQAHGYGLGLIFFGISCILLGTLIVRSGYVPKTLGYLAAAAGVVYLVGSAAMFIAPDTLPVIEPFYLVPVVSESALALWLLVGRVKREKWAALQLAG